MQPKFLLLNYLKIGVLIPERGASSKRYEGREIDGWVSDKRAR